jgi:rSAM/selenodomain-associated transferase 2
MRVSIIIPVLDEAAVLLNNLKRLQGMRAQGHEVIVVDGGSEDDSKTLAAPLVDQLLLSERGRAVQMNAAARAATGDVLLFLHVDTILPNDGILEILKKIQPAKNAWGRFDVHLSGDNPSFRVIEKMMNWRSRLSGIATGDQAIFVTQELFQQVQGYSNIPLMEDVELCQRLKKICAPICLSQQVTTSSRRWEMRGIIKTILLMWRLRLAYWLGADPENLARHYR